MNPEGQMVIINFNIILILKPPKFLFLKFVKLFGGYVWNIILILMVRTRVFPYGQISHLYIYNMKSRPSVWIIGT